LSRYEAWEALQPSLPQPSDGPSSFWRGPLGSRLFSAARSRCRYRCAFAHLALQRTDWDHGGYSCKDTTRCSL